MQNLRQSHAVQIQETRAYLETTMPVQFKPSADLLNLRKIESVLSKQKNYTEAKRVQKTVRELEKREEKAFLKVRAEKIEVQINHICSKHELEVGVLDKKLNTVLMEVDKVRKREQAALLQKFLNIQNQLHIN